MLENYIFFSSPEKKQKNKINGFKYENIVIVYENDLKNINIYHPRAHFIVIYNSSSVLTL